MTELETTVTAVAVYPDRARVVRSGMLEVQPGSYRLAVSELPLTLDTASVRASAHGTARARLLGVDVQRTFYTETPAERVRELEQAIESLQDEMKALDGQAALLKEQREALNALRAATDTYARGLAYGKTSADVQMALFDGLHQRMADADRALLELAVQRRGMERRLEKLQNELNQLRGARGRERYTATVEVEVLTAGNLTTELTYVVAQAGWSPLYDLRLLEEQETPALEVRYLAQVTQRTGEAWDSVALTLSTARPALAETLPELEPWIINPLMPPKPQAAMKMMARAAAPAAAPPMDGIDTFAGFGAPVAEAVEAEVVMAAVETSGTAVTYVVPGAVSVPADGTPRKVAVATFELPPKLDYVSAPKLVEAAYRRAAVTNDSPYTLLAGPVNLFAGDEFIGTTQLELTAPQGEIELYLGVDDRIKVKRELTRREVDKKLLGDRRRLRYAYEIALENLLPFEATVTLQDQTPISGHESIKVKLETVEPKPDEQTELGSMKWKLVLAPGAKQTAQFDFSVEHPRDMPVRGLP
ncbi:MAG: mucoidy inhibitor MuiA family protein [Anaerolineae bacterium]|nr:mucoidy inhibitor MuiA family protein [Anaerolineae bacterium]